MKPEEAIDYLQDPIGKREKHDEAIQMAIEALKAQLSNTSEIPNSSDPISRQDAITAIIGLPTWYYDSDRHYGDPQPPMEALLDPEDVVNAIENLPSAQPEQDREFMKLTVRNSNGRPYYSIIYLEFDDNGIGNDFEGYSSYSLDVISDYLKKYFMPSAQPEPHWIPCGERLPEYWKRVLVCFKAGRKCPHDQIQVGYFGTHEVEDEWFEKIGNVTVLYTDKYYYPLDNVTAWMPLPEPWEGEQP